MHNGKKKIVIVSHTIHPASLPRALRATELAKEFARQGHDVILYAALGKYNYTEFENEHGFRVRDIGKLYFVKLNSDGTAKRNLLDKILGRLFKRLAEFPDIELMFKMPKIIRKEKNVDLLITVAMPFPLHWGTALAKSILPDLFPKVWVADCGDPYMGNKVSRYKKFFYFKYLEQWFCRQADYITIPIEGAKDGYYKKFHHKIRVIPQGFRFDAIRLRNQLGNEVPKFAYSGIFYKDFRDPTTFLEFLTTVDRKFKFIIYTHNDELIKPFFEKLGEKIEVRSYIPRKELLEVLSSMNFLINFENGTKVQSPSKLIDYALAERPILSVSSNQVPATVFFEFLNGDFTNQYEVKDVDQYNIINVAKKFLDLLDENPQNG